MCGTLSISGALYDRFRQEAPVIVACAWKGAGRPEWRLRRSQPPLLTLSPFLVPPPLLSGAPNPPLEDNRSPVASPSATPSPPEPSARGPGHLAPADEVQVDVRDRLLGVWTVVKHRAVTVRQPFVGGDPLRHHEQVPDEGLVIFGQGVEVGDRLAGYDQYVRRRLGVYVAQGYTKVVLIEYIPRLLPVHDLLKQSLLRHTWQLSARERVPQPLEQKQRILHNLHSKQARAVVSLLGRNCSASFCWPWQGLS